MEKITVIELMITARNKNISTTAEEVGISQNYLSQVIRGRRNIKEDKFTKLLQNLGYTYEQYLYLEEYSTKLSRTEKSFSEQWTLLLMQTVMFYMENVSTKKEKDPTFKKSI